MWAGPYCIYKYYKCTALQSTSSSWWGGSFGLVGPRCTLVSSLGDELHTCFIFLVCLLVVPHAVPQQEYALLVEGHCSPAICTGHLNKIGRNPRGRQPNRQGTRTGMWSSTWGKSFLKSKKTAHGLLCNSKCPFTHVLRAWAFLDSTFHALVTEPRECIPERRVKLWNSHIISRLYPCWGYAANSKLHLFTFISTSRSLKDKVRFYVCRRIL